VARFRDRVAIVTGAGAPGGIGAAVARALVAQGARVVLGATSERVHQRAADLGDAAVGVIADLTVDGAADSLVRAALDRWGRVDVLVNNAGQGLHVPVEDIDLDDLRAVFELNVIGALAALQAVVPVMRRQGGGRIVNVSSGTTLFTPSGTGGYAATKAALNMLSSVARAELADDGIVVSTIYPFVTATEFHEALRAGAGPSVRPGMEPQSAEHVAERILELVESGEEQSVLVPERLLRR
jgi:NAD(P)-dependent dehydrogenase (short-subunit alcohol dehydrogenase family)